MPNWCQNSVTLTHENPDMIVRIAKGYNEGKLFAEFLPTPPDLSREAETGEGWQERSAAITAENTEKYGYPSWYEWNIDNWGTKWDVGSDSEYDELELTDGATTISLGFDSAWAPPIAFYRAMEDVFGFTVDAHYLEEGMGFVGRYNDGDDDCYDLDYSDPSNLEDIPADLREYYDLEQQFADYAEMDDAEDSDDGEEGGE
jgi:hypothetical protein